MADIKISELSQAESLSLSDLMESAIPYNGGFQSRRMTLAQLSNYLENSVLHNALDTTTKNIIGAINEILHDLANYYTTSQTYSKTEVDTLIAGVSGLHFEVVNALPTQDIDMNTIYLVPKQDSGQQDVYDEFICLDDTTTPATWEKIGTTEIDLSDYVTDTELTTILNDYVTTSGLNTILQSYATTSAMTTALADKVDKVSGKGLSTEDYTTTEKAKLNGIASGAEVNVQSDWSVSDSSSDAFIQHKPTIPTALSQLTDDSTHRVVTDTEKSTWNDNRAVAEIRLTNEDLNDVTTVGFYFASGGNSVTNKPSGVGNFGLVVIHNANGSQYVQIISNENGSYRRIKKANGTWTSWAEDKFTDENVKQTEMTDDRVLKSLAIASDNTTTTDTDGVEKCNGLAVKIRKNHRPEMITTVDLTIGNDIPVGTANNYLGVLRMFGMYEYYTDIYAGNSTDNRAIVFPDADGTVALTSELPTNPVLWSENNLLGAKNLLPYPYRENTTTKNGITFTINADYSVTVSSGSPSANTNWYFRMKEDFLPSGKYIVSGFNDTAQGNNFCLRIAINQDTASQVTYNDYGEGVEITVNDGDLVSIYLHMSASGVSHGNKHFVMIRPSTIADATYQEPTLTNRQLTNRKVEWESQNILGSKNLLPYPYINNIGTTSAGVTYTVDEKGWIHCSGTSTGNSIFTCSDKTVNGGMFLPNGNYRVSGCPEGGSSSGGNGAYQLIIDATISGATYTYCYETGDGAIFTVNGDDFSNDGAWVRVRCVCRKTVVSDSLVFKPMVMLASIKDNTYEPQANTNRQLTLNKIDKELIAPTENGFNASKAYAVGDYMIWRGGFYRVVSAISSGGVITLNTNVTKTTIGAELKRALS